ncbi:hypothetical protein LguiA_033113 [Lonicera macranthoides]
MEENSKSSQQPKAENVKIAVDDLIQSMKKRFSQYNVKDQKPVVACNYRVPKNLREGNEHLYTPKVVSIGPIHHGEPQLQTMERFKWMFLGWYLERSLVSFDDMVRVAIAIEEEARMSYIEDFDNISSQEFVEVIILDFIFLIELFFKFPTRNEQMLPFSFSILLDVVSDTILLENQFSQQLVTHLFHMLYKEHNLGDLILKYGKNTGVMGSLNAHPNDWNSATDMLDFFVMCHDGKIEGTFNSEIQGVWLESCQSATELQEAGVKFSKVVDANFLLDVKFVNGILEIPVIEQNLLTESRFRNMIASEQCRRDKPKRVSAYIFVLANLLRSHKDMVLLSNSGIIKHPLCDNQQVISLFKNLATGFLIDGEDSYFWGIYLEMHAYSRSNWHQWKGSWFKWKRLLREDYFSSPWSIISFIAAFILLILTVIQTTYTIMQK